MRGDFSRLTFDPGRAYDAVLAQQGRINLDADWNEQQLITLHRLDMQAQDIIGRSGAPATRPGFRIWLDGTDVAIGSGRYYVDGIAVDNPLDLQYAEQPYRFDQTAILEQMHREGVLGVLVYLEVWRRVVSSLEDPTLIDAALGVRDTTTRLQTVWQVQALPLTRRSVENSDPDFLLRELELDERLTHLEKLASFERPIRDALDRLERFADDVSESSADLPFQRETEFRSRLLELGESHARSDDLNSALQRVEDAGTKWLRGAESRLLVHEPAFRERLADYERATREWTSRRHIHDELRGIFDERETGRDDSRTRLQACRDALRLVERESEYSSLAEELTNGFEQYLVDRQRSQKLTDLAASQTFREWEELRRVHRPLLAVRLRGTPHEALLENQLYRVEIHDGGKVGAATFVWSRDNGAIGFAVRGLEGARVSIDDLIVDDRSGLAPGQWIELLDDRNELENRPGEIIRISEIDAARGIVVLASEPKRLLDLEVRPRVRRWEPSGASTVPLVVLDHVWLPLENGIEVKFSGRHYRTNDSWTIAARADGAGLEWPPGGPPEHGVALPPFDAPHRFAELGLVLLRDGKPVVHDRRKSFRPLTAQPLAARPPHHVADAMHIVEINWHNDRTFERLLDDGLRITFDRPPDPRCVCARAIRVTVEPHIAEREARFDSLAATLERAARSESAEMASYAPRNLRGSVEQFGQTIVWRPAASLSEAMPELRKTFGPVLLLRIVVRGSDVWTETAGDLLYCAAWAPQEPRREDSSVGLRFPSGHAEAVSDFESWCFV